LPGRLLVILLVGSAALGIAGSVHRFRLDDPAHAYDRPQEVRHDGFESSQSCRACHPAQYDSWHASFHRTMTQAATARTVIPSFEPQTIDNVHGRPMQVWHEGDALWAEFDDPDSDTSPASRARITRPVVLVTGSHNQQIFWYATGHDRLLGQLPGAYLIRERQWVPRRMAVLHPPSEAPLSETGHWNSTCIACHATHGRPQFDTPFGSRAPQAQSVQTDAAEFGISCEMCHGRGGQHVDANRSLTRRYVMHLTRAADPTIVQPQRLDIRRGSQVCGQCHSVWEFYTPDGERTANDRGLPFRPGDDLSATRFIAQPTVNAMSATMQVLLADDSRFIRDAFWADGVVRVSGREYNGLIESPCFKNATTPDRTLSCFSCHSMHKAESDGRPLAEWADAQLSAVASAAGPRSNAASPVVERHVSGTVQEDPQTSNAACLQCHGTLGADVTAHTHHPAQSPGSICYNCHMPYTTYGLLKTIRSHTIGSPTVRESVEVRRPNACNLCHLDRTLAWTGEALSRWYQTPRVALDQDQQSVAASLLWLLEGDPGQRAIVAQAMSWPPAQAASGTDWMAPFLAQLLDDPYDAVRIGAARSVRTLPGFGSFSIDLVSDRQERRQAQLRTMATWDRTRTHPGRTEGALLMTGAGTVDIPRVLSLLRQRDNHAMLLRE
jgi:hypothetical protein